MKGDERQYRVATARPPTEITVNAAEPRELTDARCREMCSQLAERGCAGPLRVLSAQECERLHQAVLQTRHEPPLDWDKGHAASSRAFYEIGTHPAILELVAARLGDDVMLWGASIQSRAPGAVHPWHSDLESIAPAGKMVSVWMGFQHTTRDSSLLVVPYSHRFGVTVQEMRQRFGKTRGETTDEDILAWARERDARCSLVQLDMTDGDALFFDGPLWHCSHNVSNHTRHALLLQYAAPDVPIHIPDLNYLDWPARRLNQPRPACIMVRGQAKAGVNRIVSAPVEARPAPSPQLTSSVYPLQLPLPPDPAKDWKPYPIFRAATADLRLLSCHASVLKPGVRPHPPHAHQEEELLILLQGELDVILPDPAGQEQRKRLKTGQFLYYPAHLSHTIQAVSPEPANYVMFKWHGQDARTDCPMAFAQWEIPDRPHQAGPGDGFCPQMVFEGTTAYLRKLHCHASTLAPGAGYEPHVDAYDVGILVLEGEVETLGERVKPHGVIFCRAGQPHGMRNPGPAAARYLVFEFHGGRRALEAALPHPPALIARLTDQRRWKRKLKRLIEPFCAATRRRK
jgi:quercetin dioxygenase-like cupin family protein